MKHRLNTGFTVSCYRIQLLSQSLSLTYRRFSIYLNILVSSLSSSRHFKEQSTNIHPFLPAIEHHNWELSLCTYQKLTFTYSVLVHGVLSQRFFRVGKCLSHGCMHHTRTHAHTRILIHESIHKYIHA